MHRLTVLPCLILTLWGCIAPVNQSLRYPPGEAALFTPDTRSVLFAEQAAMANTGGSQRIGLALSGGGVRSASFAIGALSGLDRSGVLGRLDAISSVSGGGYAAYWYMNSLYEARSDRSFRPGLLFSDCPGAFCPQSHLGGHTDLIYRSGNPLLRFGELIGRPVAQITSVVLHHAANTVFDWRINDALLRRYYQNAIERTYGLVPETFEPSKRVSFRNDESVLGIADSRAREITFEALRDETERSWRGCPVAARDRGECIRLPLWVINMTGGGNYLLWGRNASRTLSQSVFTMSQFGYGSGEFGYSASPNSTLNVPTAVAVAGAAMDPSGGASATGFLSTALESVFNVNLGYTIYNYNPDRANIVAHWALPWPLYYLYGYTEGRHATDIYLSDGGNTDNLGAYSLIARGMPYVIALDAEHDSGGGFEALMGLKHQLEREGLYLSFYGYPGPEGDREFRETLVRAGGGAGYDPHDASHSVLHLKVTGFREGYVARNLVEIIYVKAAISKALADAACSGDAWREGAYPCVVDEYYRLKNFEADGVAPKPGDNRFPQNVNGVGETESSSMFYRAYRDLGAYTAGHIRLADDGGLCYAKDGMCESRDADYW